MSVSSRVLPIDARSVDDLPSLGESSADDSD
jgi:hypothetical protein